MTEPRRNSAMIPSVKRIFERRSGVRNARANAVSTRILRLSRSAPTRSRGAKVLRGRRLGHGPDAPAGDGCDGTLTACAGVPQGPSVAPRPVPGPTGPGTAGVAHSWVVEPPAAAILSLALAEKACALTCR